VTSAQRVRLVVALGILNLIIASFAFAVGIGAPRQPEGQIAEATSAPSPALTSANESPNLGTPGPTPPPSGEPTAPPSLEPSACGGPVRDPRPDRRGDRRGAPVRATGRGADPRRDE